MKNKKLIEQSSYVFEYQNNNGSYKVIKDRLGNFQDADSVDHKVISEYLQSNHNVLVLDVKGNMLHINF